MVSSTLSQASQNLMEKHPLQRLQSPHRGWSALLHLLGLFSFAGSYYHLNVHPSFINEAYGWHWQYLTVLGLTLATATFTAGLLADLTLSPKLFLVKNSLSVCSCPLEVLVSILYWGIGFIDKQLVVPPELEILVLPDLSFHLFPSIFLVIDLLFFSPPWTINIAPALALSTTLAFGYWGIVEHCYTYNGWYPYPIFEVIGLYGRIGLFAGAALIMTGSTATLKWMVGRVNGLKGAEKRSTPANIKGE